MREYTSGTTALATTAAGFQAITLTCANGNITLSGSIPVRGYRFVNESTTAGGFFTVDGGATAIRLPAQSIIQSDPKQLPGPITPGLIRDGSTNMASVYASALE